MVGGGRGQNGVSTWFFTIQAFHCCYSLVLDVREMKLLLFVLQSDVLIDPSTVNSFIKGGFAKLINVHVQIHQILHGKKLHLYRTLCYTNSVSIHNVCTRLQHIL